MCRPRPASADAVARNFHLRLMREIVGILREIGENPESGTADDAEHQRRRLHPSREERAARERNQAKVERCHRAREVQFSQEHGDAAGE